MHHRRWGVLCTLKEVIQDKRANKMNSSSLGNLWGNRFLFSHSALSFSRGTSCQVTRPSRVDESALKILLPEATDGIV
jgi:hypothetical protein